MSVLNINHKNHLTSKLFLEHNDGLGMQRYEELKYKALDKLTEKQLGFFWQPSEVDITKDSKDFKALTEHEQHIFTANLKRQILLDSVQGRSPNLAFLPIVTLPELETWVETWAFFETIHSRSYTHIIRNIYSDPSKVFDEILDIKEIVDCADSISDTYDKLIEYTKWYSLLGEGIHTVNGKTIEVNLYELKTLLYLCLINVNILEGVRFYVSFACSWAFAELKKMEGNAKIIKFIARDENVHLASTQQILKYLRTDDPDYVSIVEDCKQDVIQMYIDAVNQEKKWAEYLFKDVV
jgi:ribonucleoside-diphosphate reductase beta chain